MGRDAVNVASAFAARIALDGVILTKLDGDARGGAALSVKAVTGVPIKFLGTGETVDRLEEFRPEGLASRILGMGDIVGLVKDFEEVIDEKEAEADAERLLRGSFGLDDLLKQMRMIQKLGPLKDVFSKLPGVGQFADQVDEGELVKVESMIQSMTRKERAQPKLIDKSRARRIAAGSGRKTSDVEQLVDRFMQMQPADGRARSAGRAAFAAGRPGGGGRPADARADFRAACRLSAGEARVPRMPAWASIRRCCSAGPGGAVRPASRRTRRPRKTSESSSETRARSTGRSKLVRPSDPPHPRRRAPPTVPPRRGPIRAGRFRPGRRRDRPPPVGPAALSRRGQLDFRSDSAAQLPIGRVREGVHEENRVDRDPGPGRGRRRLSRRAATSRSPGPSSPTSASGSASTARSAPTAA